MYARWSFAQNLTTLSLPVNIRGARVGIEQIDYRHASIKWKRWRLLNP